MNIDKKRNFRELGGIKTTNGRVVKKGLFYRSGALGYMTQEELEVVKGLGIKHILDLRSKKEIESLPDPVIEGADWHDICAFTDENGVEKDLSPEGLQKLIEEGASRHDISRFVMRNLYAGLPFHSAAYQNLFGMLEFEETPLLFHCTAGKDRTGIAAILILLVLGVDEKDALDDYMMTNVYREEMIEASLAKCKTEEEGQTVLRREGVVLENAVHAIECMRKEYGDLETYFLKEFELDSEKIKRLRELYTEEDA